jgi:hypothetical protein
MPDGDSGQWPASAAECAAMVELVVRHRSIAIGGCDRRAGSIP